MPPGTAREASRSCDRLPGQCLTAEPELPGHRRDLVEPRLAEQAEPVAAQARLRAGSTSEIGALAAEVRGERTAVLRSTAPARPANARLPESRRILAASGDDADFARPVMLGVDRAHE